MEGKMIEAGSKVKYLRESNWAYTQGEIYEVAGYDRELDAWGVISDTGEIYATTPWWLRLVILSNFSAGTY